MEPITMDDLAARLASMDDADGEKEENQASYLRSLQSVVNTPAALDATAPTARRRQSTFQRRRSSLFMDQLREPRKERPAMFPALKPDVSIGIRVITLRDIDVVKQCFSCKFDLFVGWKLTGGDDTYDASDLVAADEPGGGQKRAGEGTHQPSLSPTRVGTRACRPWY